MCALRLIDFEQITGPSWVCVLTFHISRLFLIFWSLLYTFGHFKFAQKYELNLQGLEFHTLCIGTGR